MLSPLHTIIRRHSSILQIDINRRSKINIFILDSDKLELERSSYKLFGLSNTNMSHQTGILKQFGKFQYEKLFKNLPEL